MTNLHISNGPTMSNRRTIHVDVTEGVKVRYTSCDGSNKTATVEGIDSKDGRAVIDLSGDTWCYTDQIIGGSFPGFGSVEVMEYDDEN